MAIGMPAADSWWFNIQKVLLLALANACMLWLLLWLFFGTTDWYYAEGGAWEKFRHALGRARYNYGRDSPSEGEIFLYNEYYWGEVLLSIGPPLIAALAALAHQATPSGNAKCNAATNKAKAVFVRIMGWEVPGRRFWMYWCGGLCVGEVIALCAWTAVFLNWMVTYIKSGYEYYDAIETIIDLPADHSRHLLDLERWGLTFGLAFLPCLMFLFWPLAHDSFISYITGLPWQHLIKYHRWAGHLALWVLSMHGILYYILWIYQRAEQSWWSQFSSWEGSIPFLPGSLAWFFGLVLWCTSLSIVRRVKFELFYPVHIICFIGLVLFGCIHYSFSWNYILPGLMPWLADIAFRMGQASNLTTITAASLSDDKTIASFALATDKAAKICPLSDIFVNIPSISRWQWHPFTVATIARDSITLHIKRYGSFTQGIIKRLQDGNPLDVRVMGPVGMTCTSSKWSKYEVLVFIMGGIGISPALSILRDLVAKRATNAEGAALPRKVFLVWSSRHKAEFTILDEPLMAAALDGSGWLDVALHYTGTHLAAASSMHALSSYRSTRLPSVQAAAAAMGAPVKDMNNNTLGMEDLAATFASNYGGENIKPEKGCDSSSFSSGSDGPPIQAVPKTNAASLVKHMRFTFTSPLFLSVVRPMQPKSLGLVHRACVIMLAYIGMMACMIMGTIWYSEAATAGEPPTEWKLASLVILGAFVGAMGLPVWAVHTIHICRYFRAIKGSPSLPQEDYYVGDEGNKSQLTRQLSEKGFAPAGSRCPASAHAVTLMGAQVGIPETALVLDILPNRPAISDYLVEVTMSAIGLGASEIGIFCGGPLAMVHATKLLVANANSRRDKDAPRMHFHQETFEM